MPESWSEIEIRTTVHEYLRLMVLEQKGERFVKNQVYKNLHSKIPERSAKSFEYKFQNISAVLFELQLPYLSGLKPKFNYQKLLRLIVLDEIDQSLLPNKEPWEILTDKLQDIKRKEPIKVTGTGAGRFGLSIERELGIDQNNDKSADFMGIELKTKRGKTLQTLFSRTPSEYVTVANKHELFSKYGYFDSKRDRFALYTSFSSNADSLGFRLQATTKSIEIWNNADCVMKYDNRIIEEALLSKHSQTFFLTVVATHDLSHMKIEKIVYCKWPSIMNFIDLVEKGSINLDFTLSSKGNRLRDHGFLWRIMPDSIEQLYLFNKEIEIN